MFMNFHMYFSTFRHVENKTFWFFLLSETGIAVRLNAVENAALKNLAYHFA